MNRPCLKNRFSSALSLILLVLSAVSTSSAAGLPLRSFSATYDLHKGSLHVGQTELKLVQGDGLWRWSSLTEPRGIYALFTSKRPYSETSFRQVDDGFLLRDILITDARKEKQAETASFDWDTGQMEAFRKGKRKQVPLHAEVYDYHSIHLLTASMGLRQQAEITVDFYRKGKLVKTRLVYSGRDRLEVGGKSVDADVYEQTIVKSGSKLKYYYDAGSPLLPLRIERFEDGEKSAVLMLRGVTWDL